MRYVDVILPLAIRDVYTYSIPDDLVCPCSGTRVIVPVMKKDVRGVVLREHTEPISAEWKSKIRPLKEIINEAPMVLTEQLTLWKWISEYYMCTLGEVMSAALPSGLDKRLICPPKRSKKTLSTYTGPIEPAHNLTTAQEKSIDEIEQLWTSGKPIVLLHGVTSSGKTDIYIHLIQKQLAKGKNILYLVPEIALTTQLTTRLQRIFGNALVVYHSRFTDAERGELYIASKKDTPHVVIGARSAIFLPIPNLGLIIVDEEHETSYKQEESTPRYHAKAAAIVLAKEYNANVLLGSATPSVESYYLAKCGIYGLVSLTERYAGIQLPHITLIDLKSQYKHRTMQGHFSDQLVENIRQTLTDGKQIILFQNRRGYAPQLLCTSCGRPPRCIQCDVPLTLHLRERELKCHYCGYRTPMPALCPECGGELKVQGFGTERIEEEIQTLFPQARVLRMDLDTTRSKTAYQDIINAFSRHECDILIGTQMVTKGLHFDDVRLVAVLNADPMFNLPYFRSYERAFQMLEQVAGRAGRKEQQGEVIIQTFDPTNSVFQFVVAHDYIGFYTQQLAERKLFNYPPFYRIIHIQLRNLQAERVHTIAFMLQTHLKQMFGSRVSEVITPSVERVQAKYIREINLRIENSNRIKEVKRLLHEYVENIFTKPIGRSTQIIIDVDPI